MVTMNQATDKKSAERTKTKGSDYFCTAIAVMQKSERKGMPL